MNQVRYFQAVVRCGSFTEAADECHISQSAISQQVKSLEQELGIQMAVAHFSEKYSDVNVYIIGGSHEDLYDALLPELS